MEIPCNGAAALQQQREGARTDAFQRAMQRYDRRTNKLCGWAAGRTTSGMPMPTRRLELSKVFVDKWDVTMPLKREDHAKLSEDRRTVEAQIKVGVPLKALIMRLHIICAVRLLKHIREGYESEIEATGKFLPSLDALNLMLAASGRRTNSELGMIISYLDIFRKETLGRKHATVKRVAADRLKETMHMLENARGMDENCRAMEISRACAQFAAFRSRLGEWRDRDIAGIAIYNFKKECALRIERDRWLLAQFDWFVKSLEDVYKYDLSHNPRRSDLISIRGFLDEGAPKETVLLHMRAAHSLFRVPGGERVGIPEDSLPAACRKVDYLLGHYRLLYQHVQGDQKQTALDELDFISTFVNSNKPTFILDELSKDADRYLEPVLQQLRTAVAAYNSINEVGDAAFAAAKAAFAATRDELGKIVVSKR